MTDSASRTGYSGLSKLLHWVTALLVVLQIAIALRAWKLPVGDVKEALLGSHRSIGITILLITALRLWWRATHPVPALPGSVTPIVRGLARGNQYAMYVILLLLPLSGWAMSNAEGVSVSWFGVINLPRVIAADPSLAGTLKLIHLLLNTLLFTSIALHVGGAVRHLVARDGIVQRMLPNR